MFIYILFLRSYCIHIYIHIHIYIEWGCPVCTFLNAITTSKCEMCETPNPDPIEEQLPVSVFQKQCVVFLHYFDLKRQIIKFVRFLVVHQNYTPNDILEYVEQNIINVLSNYFNNKRDKESFVDMIQQIKRWQYMQQSIIKLYHMDENGLISPSQHQEYNKNDYKGSSMQCIIFSLNDRHHAFFDDYLMEMMMKYRKIMKNSI